MFLLFGDLRLRSGNASDGLQLILLDIRACLELRRGWMETMDNGVVIGAFEAL